MLIQVAIFLRDGYTLKPIFPITATGELMSETFPTILWMVAW